MRETGQPIKRYNLRAVSCRCGGRPRFAPEVDE